ncbi:MAG: hypothetical protein Kow0058_02920 [Roseovarius sp.]
MAAERAVAMAARARTIEELAAVGQRFVSAEGRRRLQAFRPDPSDVIIAPFAKCGTTWMQQIVHGLRSGGSMDFDEITEVVPWLELAHDMGVDLDAPQRARPRAFKSHLGWDEIPKGARYIVVLRDPVDAMLSLHRFFEGWWFEPGHIGLADFARYYLGRTNNYWGHAASWWARRGCPDLLLLSYEQMRRDLPGAVRAVADFLGIDDPRARAIATAQAEFGFMKRHARQFDDHLVRAARDAAIGLPPGGVATKIDRGQSGAELPAALRALLDERWRQTLGAAFGLADYAALAAALEAALSPAGGRASR